MTLCTGVRVPIEVMVHGWASRFRHAAHALIEVTLHGVGVGEGQRQCGAHAARRADGAEQIGALVALVCRLDRPCAAARPPPREAILLADPRLVLT